MAFPVRSLSAAFAAGLLATVAASAAVDKAPFGTADGKPVEIYTLHNSHGMEVKVMTYGATMTELLAPDRSGKVADVVLGFATLDGYLQPKVPYFGATVGRVGNRIAKGHFTLNGQTYTLATNDGPNHLHGGVKGFDKVIWKAKVLKDGPGDAVRFRYTSRDGEEGYPGNCTVDVTYRLTDDNALTLDYKVSTDKATPANVTNHSYFNLGGAQHASILDERIQIDADRYTPVDSTLIPTGELKAVAGTPFDLTRPTRIGAHLKEVGGNPVGYDHNFVLRAPFDGTIHPVATVDDPSTGRQMDVFSTEPGVQFYTGNFLDGTLTGKYGVTYRQYAALCLETQHFPDSINHPNFPTTVIEPGKPYTSQTRFVFSAK